MSFCCRLFLLLGVFLLLGRFENITFKNLQLCNLKPQTFPSYSINWFLISLSIAFVQLISCNVVRAEKLNYCGLTIPLDLLKPVDALSVKVAIGSNERIIARSNLEHWALETTILDPSRLSRISTRELSALVNECTNTEPSSIISIALTNLYRRGEDRSFSARQYLNSSKENKQVLIAAIESGGLGLWENSVREAKSPGQISLLSESLAELLVLDPLWVKTKALRLYYLLSDPIYQLLYERVKEELASGNLKYISELSNSLDAFGDDSSKNIGLLKQAAKLSLQLNKEPFDSASVAAVINALQPAASVKGGQQIQDLLYPSISAKLITEITRLHGDGKLEEATKLLSLLPTGRSSPESIKMVSEILEALTAQSAVSVEEQTNILLESYSKIDPAISSLYQKFLETQFFTFINSGQLSESEKILLFILRIRPDPDVQNDELRFQQSLAYQKQGQSSKGSEKISQMQTGLSLSQLLRRFIEVRIFGNLVLIFVLFCAVFVSLWCLLKSGLIQKFRTAKLKNAAKSPATAKSASQSEKVKSKDLDPGEEPEAQSAAFVRLDRMRGNSSAQVAYEKNLRLFALDKQASLKEVKTAYRSAVKECHPDLNPGQSKELTQRFTELTQVYEELLELRRQLGIVD